MACMCTVLSITTELRSTKLSMDKNGDFCGVTEFEILVYLAELHEEFHSSTSYHLLHMFQ